MKIHNVRLGHACNSSSSHSLIFIPKKKQEKLPGNGNEFEDFGWGQFTLTDPRAKANYVAAQAYESLKQISGAEIALHVVHSIFGDAVDYNGDPGSDTYRAKYYPEGSPVGSVDHQSVWALPESFDGKSAHVGFIQELKDFILQDDLVILGGNDNGGEHPIEDDPSTYGPVFNLPRYGQFVARKDKTYGFWTLYNRTNGNKMRVSLGNNEALELTVTKASIPELVDLKITDYCPIGCAFCYQDSTKDGVHASTSDLHTIIDSLAELEVFEIAIGGGEPTMHPDFLNILRYAKDRHVTPNFTTKSLAWLKKADTAKQILDTTGMFAFSVTDVSEIEKVLASLGMLQNERSNHYTKKLSVQYVLGTTDLETFGAIAKFCVKNNIRLTILGYKQVGRGPAFTPHDHTDWFSVLNDAYSNAWSPVGIDTAVVQQFESELKAAGIPEQWYHKDEGKFSAYIDGVAMTMAPSSYEGGSVNLDDNTGRRYSYSERIQAIFANF